MTLTYPVGPLVVTGLSLLLFLATTYLLRNLDLFEEDDGYDVRRAFTIAMYLLCWVLPTLVLWIIWLIYFRGA